jgi:hypothetical protein
MQTDCAVRKCVLPEQRRAEDVGDVPRWIQLGGHVVANDGGRGTKDVKMAVE